MEDSYSFLLIEYWVGLCVTHGVLTRGVPGMKDGDAASRRRFCLTFFLHLLRLKSIDVLIHLVEAVILLVDDHVVLEHILIVCLADHRHRQLLTRQGGELARIERAGFLVAEGQSTLLIGCFLEQMSVGLAELPRVLLLRDEC